MLMTGASMSVMSSPWGSGPQTLDSSIGQRFLQAISDKTGISTADITSQLQSGGSVQDILQSKGLTMADIRQAVRSQAGQVHSHGHHHHRSEGSGSSSEQSAVLDALASGLGMSSSDLTQQLSSGTSLDKLAADKGVAMQDLAQSVLQALESSSYSSNGTATQGSPPSQGAQVNATV
jgi:uncharacterized protein (DUF433 family)